MISSLGTTSKLAISRNTLFISIVFAGNLMPSMSGSCTIIYWLLIIDHNLLREVLIIMLTTVLLLEMYVVVPNMELLRSEKVCASSAELNWMGRLYFFIKVGGSL